ncbi:MAG: hypothetical protein H0T46_07075 [Deltaproteobacteria bacterium]|nr:hypothetical protein [Deltaproteobacteria bacterium]
MIPPCSVRLPDGTDAAIDLTWNDGGWDWRVRGMLITTDELEAYLRDEVADLGAPQGVRCAPKIRLVTAGERIECWLARGGKAFFTVRADGTTAIEIAMDPTSANARSEMVTPARERELDSASRALEHADDDNASEHEDAAASAAGDPR